MRNQMKSVYNSTFSNFIKIGTKKPRSILMNMDFVFYSRSLSNVMKRVGIMEMAIPRPLSVLEFITWEKKKICSHGQQCCSTVLFLQLEHHLELNKMSYWIQNTKLTISTRNTKSPFLLKKKFQNSFDKDVLHNPSLTLNYLLSTHHNTKFSLSLYPLKI